MLQFRTFYMFSQVSRALACPNVAKSAFMHALYVRQEMITDEMSVERRYLTAEFLPACVLQFLRACKYVT